MLRNHPSHILAQPGTHVTGSRDPVEPTPPVRLLRASDRRLYLPSGSNVAVEDSDGLGSLQSGTDLNGATLIFEIETPVAGDYTLTIVGSDEANEEVQTPLEFTIEEPSRSDEGGGSGDDSSGDNSSGGEDSTDDAGN